MWRIFIGAALIVAGIAAFIEAHSHRPEYCGTGGRRFECGVGGGVDQVLRSGSLRQTPYDILRIGAWALVIVGGLLVVTGLIRYWARQAR
jgi:hypothetical protein